jgi:hypothetical protein
MKKFLICLLAFVMILAMVGCSKDDNKGGATPKDEEFALGEVAGNKYESEFIGLGFTLPEGWSFYTDEEIKEMNNYVEDKAGQDYLDLLKNATVIYDMAAASPAQTDNVVVTLEKKPNAQLNKLDLAQTLEASFNVSKSSLENMGYRNLTHEVTTLTIDGETFHAMHVTGTLSGMTMRQTSIVIKCNGYLASLAVTTFDAAGTAPLLDNIYILK